MRAFLVGLLIIALACTANAGGNPNVTFYMSFSPNEKVFAVNPEPYTAVNAYLFLGNVEAGVSGMWFRFNDVCEEYPGVVAPHFTWSKIWPGEGIWGSLWTGMYVGSTSCEDQSEEHFLTVNFYYIDGSCCIRLLEHPIYPRLVRDCSNPSEFDFWCVESHASIGGEICPDGDCSQTPVEDNTWGAVKALYR